MYFKVKTENSIPESHGSLFLSLILGPLTCRVNVPSPEVAQRKCFSLFLFTTLQCTTFKKGKIYLLYICVLHALHNILIFWCEHRYNSDMIIEQWPMDPIGMWGWSKMHIRLIKVTWGMAPDEAEAKLVVQSSNKVSKIMSGVCGPFFWRYIHF